MKFHHMLGGFHDNSRNGRRMGYVLKIRVAICLDSRNRSQAACGPSTGFSVPLPRKNCRVALGGYSRLLRSFTLGFQYSTYRS